MRPAGARLDVESAREVGKTDSKSRLEIILQYVILEVSGLDRKLK